MIELIVTIAVVGLLVWAITQFIPMDQKFKTAIVVVALICVILFVLNAFGLFHGADMPVPRLH